MTDKQTPRLGSGIREENKKWKLIVIFGCFPNIRVEKEISAAFAAYIEEHPDEVAAFFESTLSKSYDEQFPYRRN